jgi:hypothetical protein
MPLVVGVIDPSVPGVPMAIPELELAWKDI